MNHTKSLNKLTSKKHTENSLEAKEEHRVFKKGEANNTKQISKACRKQFRS